MRNRLLPPALLVLTQTLVAQAALAQAPAPAPDLQPADLQKVLQRLDRLEEQNRELMTELRALRQQLASQPPPAAKAPEALQENATAAPSPAPEAPLQDQVEVQQQRTAQLDQEKISTEHKLPLTLTGMLLENSFWTGKGGGGGANPTIAPAEPGPVNAGGTFRQSVLGVKFDGPDIFWDGKVTGSAYVDFFGGSGATLNQFVRLRVASLNTAWK